MTTFNDWKHLYPELYEKVRKMFITAGTETELEEALATFYKVVVLQNIMMEDDGK